MAFRRSPRAVRDKALPEPYRSWIDRSRPLPTFVRLLPRTINVTFDLLMFLMLGLMFGGMAALITFLPPWLAAGTPWGMLLCIGLIVFGLLLVPLVLLRRLCRTLGAARDLKRGVLRQGILVGSEGLLVRIEPNQCYPVAADRFLEAKIRVSGGGPDTEEKYLFRIETLDGPIEFFNERLADTPGNLNRTMREVWQRRD
jgi:hypothetical protein